MKQRPWYKAAICLAVGIATLTVAVFANYDNANGYSVCKNAAKDFLYETNYSLTVKTKANLDGTELGSRQVEYKVDGDGNPSMDSTQITRDIDGKTDINRTVRQDGFNVSLNNYRTGEVYNVLHHLYNPYETDGSFIGEIGNNPEMAQKLVRFGEALADTFVGDLKNNFVLTDTNDKGKTYAIELKGNQMPELVTAFASLMAQNVKTSIGAANHNNSADAMLWQCLFEKGEPFVESVNGTMTVNEQGLPAYGKAQVWVKGFDADGKEHILELCIEAEATDFGTTSIEGVDLLAIENLQYYGNGVISFTIENGDTEAERNATLKRAQERMEEGYTVRILDENGEVKQVLSKPLAEVLEEATK